MDLNKIIDYLNAYADLKLTLSARAMQKGRAVQAANFEIQSDIIQVIKRHLITDGIETKTALLRCNIKAVQDRINTQGQEWELISEEITYCPTCENETVHESYLLMNDSEPGDHFVSICCPCSSDEGI